MAPTYTHQHRNFLAFGTDTVAFGAALSFINVHTILPAFVSALGGRSASVGLLVTAFGVSWSLPQLIAGNSMARYERKKPVVVLLAFLGRITMPIMAVLIILTQANPPWLIQTMLYVALAIFLGTDAFATMGWLDMLGRAIPPDRRGRYVSIWQAVSALSVAGASTLVGYILSDRGPAFPNNFALLFALGSVALYIAAFGTSQIYEPPLSEDNPTTQPIAWRHYTASLIEIWRQDHRLRRVATARVLFSMGAMIFPFYVLYATDELRIPAETIGIFIFAQTVGMMLASLVLGRVVDRQGPQRAVQIGTLIVMSAPVLALGMALGGGEVAAVLRTGYAWIYICMGLANNLVFLGFNNYVLEIAPASQRTIYLGALNTINSIGAAGPAFAGWLLGVTSYPVLFAVSLLFGIATLISAFRLPSMRQKTLPAERGMSVSG